MQKRRIALGFFAAALFLPPIFYPVSSAQAQAPASVGAAPKIDRFDLDPPQRLAPGESLIFRLSGSPRCNASVTIDGVKDRISLREVVPGIYEAAYTIKTDDRITPSSAVTGNLRLGSQDVSAALSVPLVETAPVAGSR